MKWILEDGVYYEVEDDDSREKVLPPTPKELAMSDLLKDYRETQNLLKENLQKVENNPYIPKSKPEINTLNENVTHILWLTAQLVATGNAYRKLNSMPEHISQERADEITNLAWDEAMSIPSTSEFMGIMGRKDGTKLLNGQFTQEHACADMPISEIATYIKKQEADNRKAIEEIEGERKYRLNNGIGDYKMVKTEEAPSQLLDAQGNVIAEQITTTTIRTRLEELLSAMHEKLEKSLQQYDVHSNDINRSRSYLDDIQKTSTQMAYLTEKSKTSPHDVDYLITVMQYGETWKILRDPDYQKMLESNVFREDIIRTVDSKKSFDERLKSLSQKANSWQAVQVAVNKAIDDADKLYSEARASLMKNIKTLEAEGLTENNQSILENAKHNIATMLAANGVSDYLNEKGLALNPKQLENIFKEGTEKATKSEAYQGLVSEGKNVPFKEQLSKMKIFSKLLIDEVPIDGKKLLSNVEDTYQKQKAAEEERQRQEEERQRRKAESDRKKEEARIAKEKEIALQESKANWQKNSSESMTDLCARLHGTDSIFSRDSKEFKELAQAIDKMGPLFRKHDVTKSLDNFAPLMQQLEYVARKADRYTATHSYINCNKRQKTRLKVMEEISKKAKEMLQDGHKLTTDDPKADFEKSTKDIETKMAKKLLENSSDAMLKKLGITRDPSEKSLDAFMKTEGFRKFADSLSNVEHLQVLMDAKNPQHMENIVKAEESFRKKYPVYRKKSQESLIKAHYHDALSKEIDGFLDSIRSSLSDNLFETAIYDAETPTEKITRDLFTNEVANLLSRASIMSKIDSMSGTDLKEAYDNIQNGTSSEIESKREMAGQFIRKYYSFSELKECFQSKDFMERISKDYAAYEKHRQLRKLEDDIFFDKSNIIEVKHRTAEEIEAEEAAKKSKPVDQMSDIELDENGLTEVLNKRMEEREKAYEQSKKSSKEDNTVKKPTENNIKKPMINNVKKKEAKVSEKKGNTPKLP